MTDVMLPSCFVTWMIITHNITLYSSSKFKIMKSKMKTRNKIKEKENK